MLFTHKENIPYLEHCRVYVKEGRIVYATADEGHQSHQEVIYNIPHCNTKVLILADGTSITNQAMQKLAEEEVMVVFSKGIGIPFVMVPVFPYKSNEPSQIWMRGWFNENTRLQMAKLLFRERILLDMYYVDKYKLPLDINGMKESLNKSEKAGSSNDILGFEGEHSRLNIYKQFAQSKNINFHRDHDSNIQIRDAKDTVNALLNVGNHIAYALAASLLWAKGIPSQYPLLHGTTRQDGLVFDIADLFKDSLICAWAFEHCDIQSSSERKKAIHELKHLIRQSRVDEKVMEILDKLLQEAKNASHGD